MFRRRPPRWLARQRRERAESLRQTALALTPGETHMAPTRERPDVWAGHVEVGRPGGHWAMLVVVGNGLVSAYLSSEHGTLGLGERDGLPPAGPRWLAALQRDLASLPPAAGPPELPARGRVVIRAMTYGGPRAIEAAEEDLAGGRHPAAALYLGAQDVVAQIALFADRT